MTEIGNESVHPMQALLDREEAFVKTPKSGDVVTGEVIQISDKDLIISLGLKKDGVIPKSEIVFEKDETIKSKFKTGDEIKGLIIKDDDGDGNYLVSCKKAQTDEYWEEIQRCFEKEEPIEVKVVKVVNGGVLASYNEITGFIPLSLLSDKFVETGESYFGKTLTVLVLKVDQKKNKIIFSSKDYHMREKQRKFEEVWKVINKGDILEGKIMRFTPYGAFVDIGGIDGLLHISEMSWGKINHPEEVFTLGETINVVVMNVNKENSKISLGYKTMQPEPWDLLKGKYAEGDVITAKVVQIKEYGAFAEIEAGLDGLVHISEISHERIEHVSDVLKINQEIRAKIIEINEDKKRISLSMRAILPRPSRGDHRSDDRGEHRPSVTDASAKPDDRGDHRPPAADIPVAATPAVDIPAEATPVTDTPAAPVEGGVTETPSEPVEGGVTESPSAEPEKTVFEPAPETREPTNDPEHEMSKA